LRAAAISVCFMGVAAAGFAGVAAAAAGRGAVCACVGRVCIGGEATTHGRWSTLEDRLATDVCAACCGRLRRDHSSCETVGAPGRCTEHSGIAGPGIAAASG
jgi:hypothetical protein